MNRSIRSALCVLAFSLAAAVAAQASDLRLRVDAREVTRNRVRAAVALAVHPGPLTLVFAKWIPGEHGPNGPLDAIIGLEIRAGDTLLPWTRDPLDLYALRILVPRGVDRLDIAIDTGLPTDGTTFTSGQTNSARLAIINWNEFVLYPKGVDADRLSVEASLVAPAGWAVQSALGQQASADGGVAFEQSSLARLIDSPAQIGRYAKLIEIRGAEPAPQLRHAISLMADSESALAVPED